MKPLQESIATHVRDIPRSGIRDFFEIVQTMEDVISLGIGEPDFDTPWHIREAAIYSLEQGRTGYTSNLGTPQLREAIARYVAKHFGVQYEAKSEVIVTVGVSEAIDLALRALLNPGDEVLYHEPCYVSYNPSVALAHGVAVPIPTFEADHFRLTAVELKKRITARSKVLMLNFPCNPTGATQTREELERIAAVVVEHDLIVLTDEIYSELTYDGAEHLSIAALPGMRERCVFLHGFSKAFAMTGFRIGYACAPAVLTEAMMKIHQYSMLCAAITAQDAALEALESGAKDVAMMRREYERRRNYIVSAFNEIGLPCFKPHGSFYVFPNITSTGLSSRDFSVRLLKEKSVAVVPGPAFGASGEGFVRACYATSLDQIKIAMKRIGDFVVEVRGVKTALASGVEPHNVDAMTTLTIELPVRENQTAFNLEKWEQLQRDPSLAKLPGRVEMDRHGYVLMSPPPAPDHGNMQFKLGAKIRELFLTGEIIVECSISTADGVRVADLAWITPERWNKFRGQSCLAEAPELCVEILSPSNTKREMAEKVALYFMAGAQEVWLVNAAGEVAFHNAPESTLAASELCPHFPAQILL